MKLESILNITETAVEFSNNNGSFYCLKLKFYKCKWMFNMSNWYFSLNRKFKNYIFFYYISPNRLHWKKFSERNDNIKMCTSYHLNNIE